MKRRVAQFIALLILIFWVSNTTLAQTIIREGKINDGLDGKQVAVDPSGSSYICLGGVLENKHNASGGFEGVICNRGRFIPASAYAAIYAGIASREMEETNKLLKEMKQLLTDNTASSDKTRSAIEKMNAQSIEMLQIVVMQRFDALPVELLQNEVVKKALDKLKEDILADVKKLINKQ